MNDRMTLPRDLSDSGPRQKKPRKKNRITSIRIYILINELDEYAVAAAAAAASATASIPPSRVFLSYRLMVIDGNRCNLLNLHSPAASLA